MSDGATCSLNLLQHADNSENHISTRDGHADIFGDAHRCGYPHYPSYVGYSAILSDNAEVDADISTSAWPSLI